MIYVKDLRDAGILKNQSDDLRETTCETQIQINQNTLF